MNQNMDPNQMNNQQMGQVDMQQNMTKEELKNTQVLNLNDVQQTAKQEKKASQPKKFAIFLFLLGVLAIAGGFSYNGILSMMGVSREKPTETTVNEDDGATTKEATTEESQQATKCTIEVKGQANGTDKDVTYELNFDDNNQLQNYTKTLNMLPTTGNSTGPVTINKYKDGYTTIAGYQIPGYTLVVMPTNNGEVAGLNVVLTIDLTSLDKEKYAASNMMGDDVAQVDLELNATKDAAVQTLTGKGYKCE